MDKPVARVFVSGGSVELLLSEEITQETGERLLAQLSTFKSQPITLSIFSGGGNAHAAFAIYDYIKDAKNAMNVEVRVYGIVASGAMIIAAAATKAYIGKSAFANIHNAFSIAEDISDNDRAVLQAMNERQVQLFASRTGKRTDAVKRLMERDELLSAEEAVEFGLFDAMIEEAKIAANFKTKQMSETKKTVKVKLDGATAFRAMMGGEIEVPIEGELPEADKTALTTAQAEVEDLKAKLATAEAKVTEEATAKATAEAEHITALAAKDTEILAKSKDLDAIQASLTELKKNPLVAQLLPNGGAAVIPGGKPGEQEAQHTSPRAKHAAEANAALQEAMKNAGWANQAQA